MTLIIPPGFGNAAFVLTGSPGTQPFVTTLGVDLGLAGGDFVRAANELMTSFAALVGPQLSNSLTLDRVNLRVGQDGPGGSVDSDLPPVPMTRTGDHEVMAMAAIARKVTNEVGRRGRGRMFLPGSVNDNEVGENGVITPTKIGLLQDAMDAWWDVLTNGDDPISDPWPPVLLHSSAPVDPTPITGFGITPIVGWVRGRIR